jgi:hypothetical protein
MAKKFYYDTVGLLDLSSGSVTAGTYNSSTNVFSVAAGEVTNEHYINDQSIGHAVTDFDDEDTIRIDFGSSQSITDIVYYNNSSKDYDDLFIYASSSGTTSLALKSEIAATFAGWTANTLDASASARYWFLRSEDATLSGISEVILGTPLAFENEPDIGIATQEVFATDINKSYGGVEYANKRHEPQSTWTLNFSNISSTFKGNLASMEAIVTDYKKFVYYDDSAYHYVRLDAPIKFTEVAYQRFSASLKLREQLS